MHMYFHMWQHGDIKTPAYFRALQGWLYWFLFLFEVYPSVVAILFVFRASPL